MTCLERQLQTCLNKIQRWADENGFRFSKSKTVCMHFCHKRTLHADPELEIYNTTIPVVNETKFLGLIFDSKLNFVSHIKSLKDKCLKAINLLRVVAHTDWGADTATLLRLYRTLIRSKLDYGCVVYGSARDSYIESLDRIQNLALRICLGAFRTTPIPSLHVEAHETPLSLRRDKLALQYIIKLRANPANPAYDCVFRPSYKEIFEAKPAVIPTLGLRMARHLENSGVELKNIAMHTVPTKPPWLLQCATFVYELQYLGKKGDTPPDIFRAKLNELLSAFDGYTRIFTDGSKSGVAVAAAAICNDTKRSVRLTNNASIFSAECHAILLALQLIKQSSSSHFVILSDYLSCLQSIQNKNLHNPIILDICTAIHKLLVSDNSICFLWVPSHIGIPGNTLADNEAKAALSLQPSNLPVPYTDFKPLIYNYINKRWQQSWDTEINNKLHHIQPQIVSEPVLHLPRRDEILIHRLRVGHTHLIHAHLLKNQPQPDCTHCHVPLTVQHILIDCNQYTAVRARFYNATSLNDLFNSVDFKKIIAFIKTIGFYRKL